MDLEAPADAWYVWVGVALVSVAVAGVALGMPTTPPPDANEIATTIDRVAGSEFNESADDYEHDVRFYKTSGEQLVLKNEGGVSKATVAYGPIIPAEKNESLEQLVYGGSPNRYFDDPTQLAATIEDVREHEMDQSDPEWIAADEELYVRSLHWGTVHVTLVKL